MLKSTWSNLVLNINFMTLNSLVLEFFVFLDFIVYLRSSSQHFVENHIFNVIISYFEQILDYYLVNITYLHTTCTIF